MNTANIIRPYELSIWNLQDGFISILKPYGIETKGQIEDTSLAIKDDGTMELKFKLPMYYSQDDRFVDNPYYYNVINGNLIVNTRKIKLIFNKRQTNEKIYEFLITKINEEHGDSGAYCNIETTGLAFEELGKIGYKIVLSQDEFLLDYNNWAENDGAPANEPHATINYWCDKIFENLNWNYKIQMEWDNPEMVNNKIYEWDFISAWDIENTELISSEIHLLQEKERIVSCEKSNIYNITQDIAKTFEVYCRYEYQYDDDYHIIGKTCIFYNNYIRQKEDTLEFSFPSSIAKIVRTIDSNDIVTKMYVVPIEDTNAESGSINIANSPANKMREDYILNFDYLYASGAINETQYNDLVDYQRSMFNYNNEIENLTNLVSNYQILKTQYEANKTFYGNAITQDEERISDATESIAALTDGKEVLEYTTNHYYRCVLVDGKVNITQEGVFDTYTFTEGETTRTVNIEIYYANSALEKTKYEGTYQLVYDENNNLVGIEGITLPKDDGIKDAILYLTFAYKPSLKYENIKAMYEQRLAQDTANLDKANENLNDVNNKLKEANEKLAQKLKEKKKIVDKLTNSMGCAMREGSWTAENYSDYGRHYTDKFTMSSNTIDNRLSPIWDTIPFDDELTAYDKETVNQIIKWHEVINIEGLGPQTISSIISHMSDLQYGYFINDMPSIERFLQINSRMYFGFYKDNNVVKRCLILVPGVKMEYKEGSEKRLCFRNKNGEYETIKILANSDFIKAPITLCYPRIRFLDKNIKKTYDEITVKVNGELKQKFYDYSILYRYEYKDTEGHIRIDNNYYLTIDTEVLFPNMNAEITLNTAISTASTSLYLDALKVAKENAFPKISYEADLSAVNKKVLSEDFNYLTRIIKIEDKDLHLREVYGYVSELNLDLNQPWADKIVIKNYKTKFEDLFSSIVASTEQMKSNGLYYDRAAGSFNSNGTIKGSILQNSINQNDLTYEFQSGNLTINEIDGIWARNDKGVVAIRGGGIFCATQTDSQGNYLWNTGITPSGINASQITAGQLDTNLVNIYAGDNLRLQLRGDGLFAFYADENGVIDKDKYVVHNNDGLFLKQLNEETHAIYPKVAISWDGLVIKNNNGDTVFSADENGNLDITGNITATGKIGKWEITQTGLGYRIGDDPDYTLLFAPPIDKNGNVITDPEYAVLKATENFKVLQDGTLRAKNAEIQGNISAKSIIGGLHVSDISNSLKKLDIVNISGGNIFNYNNDNLDLNYTVSPDFIRVRILTNSLSDEELTTSDWQFKYHLSGSDSLGGEVWIDITNETTGFSFDKDYLIISVDKSFMLFDKTNLNTQYSYCDFKVIKAGKKIVMDDNNEYPKYTESGEIVYENYSYEVKFTLYNNYHDINKTLSDINPNSYNYVKNEEGNYENKTFEIILSKTDITYNGAIISNPDVNMIKNGYWKLGNLEILTDEQKVSYNVITEEILDASGQGTGNYKSQITVPANILSEGNQIVLYYYISKASRLAYLSKPRAGKGIDKVEEYYLANASKTNPPAYDSLKNWKTNINEAGFDAVNKYLWNCEVITYSNGDITKNVRLICIYVVDGVPGQPGRGIKSYTEYYLANNDKDTIPSYDNIGWTTTPPSVTTENKYLWNYEAIVYTKGDNSTDENPYRATPRVIGTYGEDGKPGENGKPGKDGVSVKTIEAFYKVTNSADTPLLPEIITKASLIEADWHISAAQSLAFGQFLWSTYFITYTDENKNNECTVPFIVRAYNDNIIQSEQIPENPKEGDLWLDTSSSPYKLKRYNGIVSGEDDTGWETISDYDSDIGKINNTIQTEIENFRKTLNGLESRVETINETQTSEMNSIKKNVSTIQETANNLTISFETTETAVTALEEIQKKYATYFNFDNNGLLIGKRESNGDNPFQVNLNNEKLSFLENNKEVAYISNNELNITNGIFKNSLKIGHFGFIPEANGAVSFIYLGGD